MDKTLLNNFVVMIVMVLLQVLIFNNIRVILLKKHILGSMASVI